MFPDRRRWRVDACHRFADEGRLVGRYEIINIVKCRLYARAGIAEYWVIDVNARQLHLHREPLNGGYSIVTVHCETESVSSLVRPDASVHVADLLPPYNG